MQKERASLDRALARRPDRARRVAVIVVALAAAAATFFFFSPMARCRTHRPLPLWQNAPAPLLPG